MLSSSSYTPMSQLQPSKITITQLSRVVVAVVIVDAAAAAEHLVLRLVSKTYFCQVFCMAIKHAVSP